MRVIAVPLFALLALLAACAGGSGNGGAGGDAAGEATRTPPSAPADGDGPAGGGDGAGDDLVVEIDRGDGTPVERYTLTCGASAAGDLPEAQAACAHLAGMDNPFAPLPDDVVCTEQYGGPQTARVTGRWHGEPVDLELSRVDGCRISQWDALGPVLPGPVGVEAPPS